MILQWLISLAQWFLNLLTGGIHFVVAGIVVPTPAEWIIGSAVNVATLMAPAAKLGYWVPWGLVVAVAGTFALCVAAALVIQIVRIVASFASFGGGAV